MMDKQLTTVKIPEREALPVRAIPYVTGWDRFTPVALVRYLAQDPDRFTEWDKPLTAYVRRDGAPVAVAPSDWDRVLRILKSFEAQTGPVTDPSGDEVWLEHAAEKIPAGLFVWLDEFTDVHRAYCDKFDEKNKTLDLDPLLMDDATRAMVMEGFTVHAPEVVPVVEANPAPAPRTATLPAEVAIVNSDVPAKPLPMNRGWVMKKAALISRHQHQWPTINGDFQGASENGLTKAAKSPGHGDWFEADALNWARQRGKLHEATEPPALIPATPFSGLAHRIKG